MRRSRRTLVVVAFALASCSTQVLPASTPTTHAVTLRLYSVTATIPLLNDLIRSYSQLQPEVSFDVQASNYAGVIDLLADEPDAYFVTNHLPPEASLLWGAPIGQDGIAIVTHPEAGVTGLSIGALRDIYQGRVTNWAAVGGADLEIVVVSREDGSGTRAEFERLVMGDRRTTRTALVAPSSAAMLETVAREAGSIGYVSMGYTDDRVRVLAIDDVTLTPQTVHANLYPLRATLFIAGLREPEGALRAFIAWVQSPGGQAAVGRKYAALN